MHRHLAFAGALLLSACAHSGYGPWDVPVGSTVTINEEITIPADSASVNIQNGKTMSFTTLNMYHPHCAIEVRKRLDRPQIVTPGRFTVTKNFQYDSYTALPMTGNQVAMLLAGGDSAINYVNEMVITSPAQSDVWRLLCKQYSFPSVTPLSERYTTVAQMQTALGKLITIEIKSQP